MEEERNLKMIRNIKDNYRQVEKFIVEQLYMKNDLHGTTIGTEREDIWEQLFEMVLPKKFVIEHSVFIIDSNIRIENEKMTNDINEVSSAIYIDKEKNLPHGLVKIKLFDL